MPTRDFERAVARATSRRHAILAEDLARLREDAGLSRSLLASASGVDPTYLGRIERGDAHPTVETYQRLATALGADLSTRLYPNTGPAIRDRHQARILELLLREAHPRFERYTEVRVDRPVRGWIDVVLHEPRERVAVATEIESLLRRLEQLVRWHAAKADALAGWDGALRLGDEPRVERLLVVRRTRGNRDVAMEFERQLRAAYPAHPDDALAALTGNAPWPGPAMLWVTLDGARTRFASGR